MTGIQTIAEAQKSIKIFTFKEDDIRNKLIYLIEKVHANCAKPLDVKLVKLTIGDLVKLVRTQYGFYSIDELEAIFDLGWQGQLGQSYGLSNQTYRMWLETYKHSEIRQEAARLRELAKALPAPKEPTAEEKDKAMSEMVDKLVQDFKSGRTPIITSIVYDYLYYKGLVNYTDEERMSYRERAVQLLLEEEQYKKDVNPFYKMVENFDIQSDPITNKAKALAAESYIRQKSWE